MSAVTILSTCHLSLSAGRRSRREDSSTRGAASGQCRSTPRYRHTGGESKIGTGAPSTEDISVRPHYPQGQVHWHLGVSPSSARLSLRLSRTLSAHHRVRLPQQNSTFRRNQFIKYHSINSLLLHCKKQKHIYI